MKITEARARILDTREQIQQPNDLYLGTLIEL